MDAGEDGRQLLGQCAPRAGVFRVAEEPACERLSGHEVHDEEGRAEDTRVLLAPVDARHGHAGVARDAEQPELLGPARLDVVTGRVATEDEPLPVAGGADEVERPRLA
jgi:hypothetical protein